MIVCGGLQLQPRWLTRCSRLQSWQADVHTRPCVSIHSLSWEDWFSIDWRVVQVDVVVASALCISSKVAKIHMLVLFHVSVGLLIIFVSYDVESLDHALVLKRRFRLNTNSATVHSQIAIQLYDEGRLINMGVSFIASSTRLYINFGGVDGESGVNWILLTHLHFIKRDLGAHFSHLIMIVWPDQVL